jgi:hypothetical protein
MCEHLSCWHFLLGHNVKAPIHTDPVSANWHVFVGSPGYRNRVIDHYLFPKFPVEMEPWQAQSVPHTILHCVASRNVSLFAELLDVLYFNWKWILPLNQHIHVQGVNEGIILGFLPLNLRHQIYRSLSFVSHSQSALKSLTNCSMTWNLSFVSHGQIALKAVTNYFYDLKP